MKCFVLAAVLLALVPPVSAQLGGGSRVHDPVVMKCGDAYYLFSTSRGISIRRSTDLLTWESIGSVFQELPQWVRQEIPDARNVWAPDISHFNGRYHLYYSTSTFGKNRSCIGLATNVTLDPKHPDYKWIDHGKIVESRPEDDFNAIDPNIFIDEDATPWMSLGSYWSGIKLLRLDPRTGRRADEQMRALASRPKERAIEAPFIIRRGEWFYLFVSFDQCCKGVDSTYKIMVGRSKRLTGPYEDKEGTSMLQGGGSLVLESYDHIRGPGHCAVLLDDRGDFLFHHFYDASERGVAKLQIRPLTWDDEGWPIAGKSIINETAPKTPAAPTERALTP